MAHILHGRSLLELVYTELPPFALALLIAETFFKFGSFSLEAVAFIVVWYALSLPYTWALSLVTRNRS
ncbi:MAG: hypothetical protein M3546_04460 [Actinomycetota bacterium]|nr:hypothetical protein [Actinomycetota bacterium]